jgi:hypothetical protein
MACGDLFQSELTSCENPIQGGVGDGSRLTLILKEDIDGVTYDVQGRITAITLVSGRSAYSFDGIKQSLKPRNERVASPSGQSVYRHTVQYVVYSYTQASKNNLQRLANGQYVAIYANAKQDTNAFEVMGVDVGLEVTEMIRAAQEENGTFRITLASPENQFESKLPATLTGASYSAIKAIVDGLLFLPTITASGLSVTAAAAAGGTALTITGTNFFGGGVNTAIVSVQYVNNATGAVVNQVTLGAVTSTTQAVSTVAMAVGSYKVRITTLKGVAISPQNLTVS